MININDGRCLIDGDDFQISEELLHIIISFARIRVYNEKGKVTNKDVEEEAIGLIEVFKDSLPVVINRMIFE